MIRIKYFKTILGSAIVILVMCSENPQAQTITKEQINNDNEQKKPDIGRDNPFLQYVVKKPEPIVQEPIETTKPEPEPKPEPEETVKQVPELFVETVTLKYLNAKSLEVVLTKLSSEYGSICADAKSNSLIICDTEENIPKILKAVKKADGPSQQVMAAETVTLKFLEAKNLKEAMEKMLSAYGSIAVDVSTNSIIVCDTREKVNQIIDEIKKADQTPKQVMIEVVIVDVQLDNDTEIGVNWDHIFESTGDMSYTQKMAATFSTVPAATTGGEFHITSSGLTGTIRALQEVRNVEILASPRVLVVSGEDAFIQTAEEIPYTEITGTAEGGSNALTSTKFKDAGITLTVKAIITDDKKILMTIKPEQSVKTGETGVGNNDVPIVDKRITSTTLLMDDDQVLVMGGLRRKETRIYRDQVPLLGDLPLIGFFFANNKEETRHSELLVFISPHIYKNEPLSNEEFKRFSHLREQPILRLPDKKNKEEIEQFNLVDEWNDQFSQNEK